MRRAERGDPKCGKESDSKADLEKLLKNVGHMPEDKYLLISRKGKRLGSRIRARHEVKAEQGP
jgi:hypothetical protein